jgi:hypothetical protein
MAETGQYFFSLFNSLDEGRYIGRTVSGELAFALDLCQCRLPADGDEHTDDGFVGTTCGRFKLIEE